MKRNRMLAVVAVGSAASMLFAACSKSTDNGGSNGTNNNTSGANAAVDKVFTPSDQKGGTLHAAVTGDWDSLDPGDTYYGFSWNFARNYGRSLMVFKSAPGAESNKVVPDLAEAPGVPSDNAKTWTYKIRKGIKYEDGTEVKAADIKYAIGRALDKEILPNGPTYIHDILDLKGYPGVFKDKDLTHFTAIETPDDYTVVFHLNQSFGGFDYFAALPETIPVPAAKDTGTKYKEHVVATGPYMFASNDPGKNFVLKRNPNYDASTDPNSGRKALPDEIDVALGQKAEDIDNRLISGDLDIDLSGSGVQTATQAKVLNDAKLKAQTDNAGIARTWFAQINSDVAPLDNVDCRKAIEYAADHDGYQRAYGGSVGGDIATSVLPPLIPGYQKIDPYGFLTKPNGDTDKAKEELQKCGHADGFSINISYRQERTKEKDAAVFLQQSLSKVGIKAELKPFPQGDYFKLYAGKPDYAKANGLGVMIAGWGADWSDGYGFLQQIADSRVIHGAGNTNLGVKDPAIDALFDKAYTQTNTSDREKTWAAIDAQLMNNAWILPGIWAKGLHFRNSNITNVFFNENFGMYDFAAIGVAKK